jgi:hypothetical protein
MGSQYKGSYKNINKAGRLSGARVGTFGNASGRNEFIADQRSIQQKIANIDSTNTDMQARKYNDLNYIHYNMQTDGGWDYNIALRGK